MNNIELLKEKIKGKKILLSLDLDDTFVNRDLGANYVTKRNIKALQNLVDNKNITVIVNTGREKFGYSSFCNEVINVKNAILGSGSVVEVDGKYYFDSKSAIETEIIDAIIELIKDRKISFCDLSTYFDRFIIHRSDKYSELFFAQNPTDWFKEYPKIKRFDEEIDKTRVFRIEMPIAHETYPNLFNNLGDKRKNCFTIFSEILGEDIKYKKEYFLKRKSYFKDIYHDEIQFARLEVDESVVNKGTGLRLWIEKSGISEKEYTVIHIGDKDHGIVNDTIIKSVFPNSLILMVGEDFDKKNPLVDSYFEGDIDENVALILETIGGKK